MPHYGLSASLIFDSRQQKQYRRFQLQSDNISVDKLGALPTAAEYAAFEVWRKGNDSGYFSDTPLCDPVPETRYDTQEDEEHSSKLTALCGHSLHPVQWHEEEKETENKDESSATKKPINRCPSCVLEMHARYTNLLLGTLKSAGGFMDQRWEAPPDDNPILEAYEAVKIRLVQAITRVEKLAVAEREWEQEHPDSSTPAGIKTAEEALRKYWASVEFATPRSSPQGPGSRGDEKKPKRNIRFADDTQFERGRDMIYFHRRSHRYEPGGRYYVPSTATHEDADDSECETDREDEVDSTQTRLPWRLSCPEMPFSSSGEDGEGQVVDEEEEELMTDDGDSEWEDVESEAGDEGFLFETDFIEFGY